MRSDGRAGDPEMMAVRTLLRGGAGGARGEEGKVGRMLGREADRGDGGTTPNCSGSGRAAVSANVRYEISGESRRVILTVIFPPRS